MNHETDTLAAIMVQAERFCLHLESLVVDRPADPDINELRLKLNQSKAALADLQEFYNRGELSIRATAVRSGFRFLILHLLWLSFHARKIIDYKTFRMLVSIDAAFSHVLDGFSESRAK